MRKAWWGFAWTLCCYAAMTGAGAALPLDKGESFEGEAPPPVAAYELGIRLVAGTGGGVPAGTPIRNGVIRLQETGAVVSVNTGGIYRFRVNAVGPYRAFVSATGYRSQGPVIIVLQETSPVPLMTITLQPDPEGSRDSDGDGLSDFDEINIYGTDPNNPDTDGDGMSDLFEVEYGFDPLDPSDGPEDADNDLLSNVEEFRLGTNPRDGDDPATRYFVSIRNGDDLRGDGSARNPWQTIGGAQENLRRGSTGDRPFPDSGRPALFILGPGVYDASLILDANIQLGTRPGTDAVLEGSLEAGAGAAFYNLRFRENDDKDSAALLTILDNGVVLRQCVFEGQESSNATGILFLGANQSRSQVIDSRFENLKFGIEIFGGLPQIRRSIFDGILDVGVVFREIDDDDDDDDDDDRRRKGELVRSNSFGDIRDPESGFNVFVNLRNRAVVNERPETITMQNNDWGIDDISLVEQIISGPALVPPILPPQGVVLAGAIFATVWDISSRDRILNASAVLQVSTYQPVTNNVSGVYAFPAVPDGQYTVRINAPDYDPAQRTVNLAGGQLLNLSFPLSLQKSDVEGEGAVEGEGVIEGEGVTEGEGATEGEGEEILPPPAGCQCNNTPTGASAHESGTAVVLVSMLLALALFRSRYQPTGLQTRQG